MRFIGVLLAGVGLLGAVLLWWLKFDAAVPEANLEGDRGLVGRNAEWVVNVRDRGRTGLEAVEIRLTAGERTIVLAERTFPASGWLGRGVDVVRIPLQVDLDDGGFPEGSATLEVLAETHGWRMFGRAMPIAGTFAQEIDRTPPRAQVVSEVHNARLGGSAAAVFRLGEDATDAEVRVAQYRFAVVRDYFADSALALSLFAIPENLTAAAQPMLRVIDAAGNAAEVPIPSNIRPREFRDRTLEIDDSFLGRKIPQIFAARGLPVPDDLLEGYLVVNRDIRTSSEESLREMTRQSAPHALWSGAFRRMPRAQTMSEFGDRRSYAYGGRIVDRQTHLGVDLASLKGAEVGASQDGVVVFAGDLGIYGETVVIDHGLGVFTLYGHLSSISVKVGDSVVAGLGLGTTGQTGLAGGDHLHFSIMVGGVHVDPVEWWDAKWLRDHIAAKIELFPRRGEAPEKAGDGEEEP